MDKFINEIKKMLVRLHDENADKLDKIYNSLEELKIKVREKDELK